MALMRAGTRDLLIRAVALLGLLYLPHFIKNTLVSVYHLESLINMPSYLRVFNKSVALEVFAFLIIMFCLYNRAFFSKLVLRKPDFGRSFILVLLGYLSVGYYYASQLAVNALGLYQGILPFIIVATQFISLALYLVLVVLGVFGFGNLKSIYDKTHPQPWWFLGAGIVLTAAMVFFERAWLFFSSITASILAGLFSMFYDISFYLEEGIPVIIVNDFAISIGSPCSGIDSMLLFIAFNIAIYSLDRKRISLRKAVPTFLIGFCGVFVVNVLRLLLLILVGVHISRELSAGLFHANAGWVFFILYFIGYYFVAKKLTYLPKNGNLGQKVIK
jgi:exosortase/archaeosortase family protein